MLSMNLYTRHSHIRLLVEQTKLMSIYMHTIHIIQLCNYSILIFCLQFSTLKKILILKISLDWTSEMQNLY
jgi:hypothetical protein